MRRRLERINDLLRLEISELLLREVQDPRLGVLLSVTQVDTSPDLKRARVFVSVMGSEAERREALRGLRSAAPFVRRELAHRLDLRSIPEVSFHLDDSLERGARVLEILREVAPENPLDEER